MATKNGKTTRADKIYGIIKNNGGRMKVSDLISELAKVEDTEPADLQNKVPPTVRQDNETRRSSGRAVRFKRSGDETEEYGYIGIYDASHSVRITKDQDPYERISELIEASNESVRNQLKEAIQNLSWQEFESSFMTQVLEALGFSSVEVTQATRDGGVDAKCFYNRGIIRSEACVSAKQWKSKVRVNEVRSMRGVGGNHDTVIIFTSSKFTPDAEKEAEPRPNSAAVVLIHGDLIVDTCFREGIGIRKVPIPAISEFVGLESESA